MKVKFYAMGDEYEVTDGSTSDYVSLKNLTSNAVYADYQLHSVFNRRIASGEIIVTEAATNTASKNTLTIEVDSSQVEKALALVKELEATLLRVHALMPKA